MARCKGVLPVWLRPLSGDPEHGGRCSNAVEGVPGRTSCPGCHPDRQAHHYSGSKETAPSASPPAW